MAEQHFDYHLNLRNMSGRVVRFRLLDPDEVEDVEENAARGVGDNADEGKLRRAQLKLLTAAFIVSYTAPGQEPERVPLFDKEGKPVLDSAGKQILAVNGGYADLEKLKGVEFKAVTSYATLERCWKDVFTARETQALRVLFMDHHEIGPTEIAMILGKSRPAPTGD
jgi:hypothetical protein